MDLWKGNLIFFTVSKGFTPSHSTAKKYQDVPSYNQLQQHRGQGMLAVKFMKKLFRLDASFQAMRREDECQRRSPWRLLQGAKIHIHLSIVLSLELYFYSFA